MARYTYSFANITLTPVADAAAMTDAGYCGFIQGGSGTHRLKVNEVSVSGESSATSTPSRLVFAGDSTVAATGISGGRNAIHPGNTAQSTTPVAGHTSTTKPQRSATLHYLYPTLNALGGIYRWQARQGEELEIIGNTASLGEMSLSSINGTGPVTGHILYEAP